jgi:bacteriocin-like protein
MADTRAIFDALLAPSKNPLSGDTRQKVFKVMNDEELNAVIGYCLTQGPDREDRQEIAEFLLDKIAKKATESESNSNSDETQTSGNSSRRHREFN